MKLAGALLCVAASVLFGVQRIRGERKKLRAYRCLADTLRIIKSEGALRQVQRRQHRLQLRRL